MKDIEEIKSILWHEIGHLLIDLFLVNSHSDISISKVVIRNYECKNIKWCGYVDLIPSEKLKYNEVVKNDSLTAFKFLSLVSGCLFQSEFATIKLDFKDCFAFKNTAIGKGDHDQFYQIPFKLREAYDISEEDKKKFYQKLDKIVFQEYPKEILKLDKFISEMYKFIAYLGKVIITDFNSKSNKEEYSFIIQDEFLVEISEKLIEIMKVNGFTELLNSLHQELVDTIQKYFIKDKIE